MIGDGGYTAPWVPRPVSYHLFALFGGPSTRKRNRNRRTTFIHILILERIIHPLMALDQWRKREWATLSSPALFLAASLATMLITTLAVMIAASLATVIMTASAFITMSTIQSLCFSLRVVWYSLRALLTMSGLGTSESVVIVMASAFITMSMSWSRWFRRIVGRWWIKVVSRWLWRIESWWWNIVSLLKTTGNVGITGDLGMIPCMVLWFFWFCWFGLFVNRSLTFYIGFDGSFGRHSF